MKWNWKPTNIPNKHNTRTQVTRYKQLTGDKKVWSLIKIWISVIKKNKNKKLAKKTFFVRKQRHSLRQAHSFWYVSIKSKSIKRILVKFHTIVSWYGAGFFLTNCNNVNEFFLIKIKAWRHFSCIARYLIYLMAFVFFCRYCFECKGLQMHYWFRIAVAMKVTDFFY